MTVSGIDTSASNKDQRVKTAGGLTLTQNVSAGTGTVNLEAATGGVTQTGGIISAARLNVAAKGTGSVSMQQVNQVQTLDAVVAGGGLQFKNGQAVTVARSDTSGAQGAQVLESAGAMQLSGTVTAGTQGTITLTAQQGGILQTAGTVTTQKLSTTAGGTGDVLVQQAGNAIQGATASVANGQYGLNTTQAVVLGKIDTAAGQKNQKVQAGGAITLTSTTA
jgi:hypothetical protein